MKHILTCIAVAAMLASFAGCSDEQPQPPAKVKLPAKPAPEPEPTTTKVPEIKWRTVKRIIAGNTLELDSGEKVRLLGVSIPEHFREEAAEFARKKAEGQEVRLEYDQTRKDKDSRILAYIRVFGPHFIRRDGLSGRQNFFLNEDIVYQGYGLVDMEYPFKEVERYKEFEKEARKARRGLWASLIDIVHITDGRTLKGWVTSETEDEVLLEMELGIIRIDRNKVTRIERKQK